jgi:hypothetical protein
LNLSSLWLKWLPFYVGSSNKLRGSRWLRIFVLDVCCTAVFTGISTRKTHIDTQLDLLGNQIALIDRSFITRHCTR